MTKTFTFLNFFILKKFSDLDKSFKNSTVNTGMTFTQSLILSLSLSLSLSASPSAPPSHPRFCREWTKQGKSTRQGVGNLRILVLDLPEKSRKPWMTLYHYRPLFLHLDHQEFVLKCQVPLINICYDL